MPKPPKRKGPARIFIADSNRMSCQLITAALHQSPFQSRVVGYATDAVGICEGLDRNEADVALISAHLREGTLAGFNAVRQIRASRSKLNVVMILDSMEPTVVVEAFRAGASGIFSRDESFELLCKCIHAVYQGQVWASSRELHFVIDGLRSTQPAPTQAICPKGQRLLTDREEGVVRLVAEGLTNRDISQHLNLSEHTVRNYLFRIFNKVGTSNRLELALYSIDRSKGDNPEINRPA
jgi:DNA-binding NarL/FixJ family response regulator